MERFLPNEAAMLGFAGELAPQLAAGDVVLLSGELGAGKTTLTRGILAALGHVGPVRSPTFNLIQTFDTVPPVMHADLYRVSGYEGIGIEDYLPDHLCLIEWPDRAMGLVAPLDCWRVDIEFNREGRKVSVLAPGEHDA